MTIVVVPAPPLAKVGPGLTLIVDSSFTPFPVPGFWTVGVAPISSPGSQTWLEKFPTVSKNQGLTLGTAADSLTLTSPADSIDDEIPVNVQLFLFPQGGGISLDQGQTTSTWDTTSGLGRQADLIAQIPIKGQGLTPTEAQQLDDVHASTFPTTTVADLGQVLLNPVPSGGPINANLITPGFGCIVRITRVPEDIQPQTPDELYWVPTLAVVRLFRGSDLWLRVPVHTESKIIGFFNELVTTAFSSLFTLGWPLSMTLQVTFRPGVEGQVLLLNFP